MMSKLVILKIVSGNFDVGFTVTLQIAKEGQRPAREIEGKLPPNPEILQQYENWRVIYFNLGSNLRLDAPSSQTTNCSTNQKCKDAAEQLIASLESWLDSRPFQPVREELLHHLNPSEPIRFLLQTDDLQLQKLPWYKWSGFFSRYPKAELAISSNNYQQIETKPKSNSQVNILAILGNSQGIDTEADRELLQKLPDVNLQFLPEPERQQLNEKLWQEGWDLLFFAGHSGMEGEKGKFAINQTDSLAINNLTHALQQAIKGGLKLAIFNSCDGLGLAQDLADLDIPQVIFMREPVPDLVAQEFLKYFLAAYAGGESLYLAVKQAREKLQGLEGDFPCASWLPVIYQNASQISPSWQELRDGIQPKPERELILLPPLVKKLLHPVLVTTVAVSIAVLGVRSLGLLEGWELKTYDLLLRSRQRIYPEGQDSRFLVITVDEEDIQYQEEQGMKRKGSLSDAALSQVLQKLEQYGARTIGLDIYRDFPVRDDQPNLANQLGSSNFFAVCKGSEFDVKNPHPGVSPPQEVPSEQLGFSDFVVDDDGVLRRHLWYATFDRKSLCTTTSSLSLRLALHYLAGEGIIPEPTPEGNVKLGNAVLTSLKENTGVYQKLDTYGYQMLLNYRDRDIAQQIGLKQFLREEFDPNKIKDKIVLIGVIAPSVKDYLPTPYSKNSQLDEQMGGVFLQAQMASQIISAVENGRPLLSFWPRWVEIIWIVVWSLLGGLLAWRFSHLRIFIVIYLGTNVILYGICLIFLIQGLSVPLVPSVLALGVTGASLLVLRRGEIDESCRGKRSNTLPKIS